MISRERILEAAARVYAKHGFRGATTRLIAIEAGVNEVTLFRTFGSKGALLEAVLVPHHADNPPAPLPDDPVDPVAELTAFVTTNLERVRAMRPLLIHTMGEIDERPEAAEFACRGRRMIHDTITRYIRTLQERGMANPDTDVDTAAVMLTGTVMSDAIARAFVPEVYPPLDEAADRYVKSFLQLIGARKAARRSRKSRSPIVVAALLAALCGLPSLLHAQTRATGAPRGRSLSLDEAIRLAAQESEVLQIARAGVTRASGQQLQARSQYLPQVNSSLAYARTLKSQFSALSSGSTDTSTTPRPQSVCAPAISANATAAERAAAIAQASTCPSAAGLDLSKVGFGARNSYTLGLSVSQSVFSGGRISGQTSSAEAQRRSAEIEVVAQRAQLALDVTQAYFDAVLADQLVLIADTTLAQTEELLRQTQVARQVGNVSEFDLLRATVTRDNQRPVIITRRGDRDVAYFRLKQLLNVALEEPIQLTTPIDEPATVSRVIAANASSDAAAMTAPATGHSVAVSDTTTASRAPVRESEEAVRAQEGLLTVARADLLPSLAITTNYQRLFFPSSVFPSIGQYSENWTVGGTLTYSIFSGGRVTGQVEVAQANLDEARARLQQSKELASLDTRVALNQLQSAEASFAASRGTAQQAQRAYSIDQLRYTEGLSTQTDLTQSRLLLEQAVANRAQSARDLAVARARVALIRDLPVNTSALGAAAQRAAAQQTQPQPQQQRTQSTAAGSAGASQSGGVTP